MDIILNNLVLFEKNMIIRLCSYNIAPAHHFPALRRRWSAVTSLRSLSELALRAIRHPDACERRESLVVLVRMSVLLFLPGMPPGYRSGH